MNELQKSARNALKGGLMMMESLHRLTTEFEGREVEDTIAETVSIMLDNTDDPVRQRRIISLVAMLGERMNSKSLQGLAADLMEQWENGG